MASLTHALSVFSMTMPDFPWPCQSGVWSWASVEWSMRPFTHFLPCRHPNNSSGITPRGQLCYYHLWKCIELFKIELHHRPPLATISMLTGTHPPLMTGMSGVLFGYSLSPRVLVGCNGSMLCRSHLVVFSCSMTMQILLGLKTTAPLYMFILSCPSWWIGCS